VNKASHQNLNLSKSKACASRACKPPDRIDSMGELKAETAMSYPIFSTRGVANATRGPAPAAKTNEIAASSAAAPMNEAAQPRAPRRRIEVLETYFGADGRPAKRKGLGAARVARRYDESGNKVEEAYFNAEGKPTPRKDNGVARIAWRYDESGNPVEAAYFAADGTPIGDDKAGLAELALPEAK
jgi:YD repeat-containing protein